MGHVGDRSPEEGGRPSSSVLTTCPQWWCPAVGLQPTVTLGIPRGGGPRSQVFHSSVEPLQHHQPVLLSRHLNPSSVGSHQVPEAPEPPQQHPGLKGLIPSSSNL